MPHFSSCHIGAGPDPTVFIWFLAWWAHAITCRLNPLFSNVLFVPGGASLAWATDVRVAGLLATPLTLTIGPVATYNALMLLAPGLAGWAAFILCRYLAQSWRAGWLGGFIFGFSPYIAGGMLGGHLHVLMVFPIPLLVWLVLRRLGGEISVPRFVGAMVLLLVAQLGCAVELFATTAAFGALALGLALLFTAVEERNRLRALIVPIAACYAITAVIASPLLYFMLVLGHHRGFIFSPWLFSADLLGLFIPTAMNELGRPHFFAQLTQTFRSGFGEDGTYIALPLLIVAVLYARSYWRTAHGRMLVDLLVIGCVLSLGPWLEIAGHITIGLPWLILEQLPLLGKALPVRLTVYPFLILALMTSIWISSPSETRWKWILGATVVAFMLPTFTAAYWVQPLDLPQFLSSGAYRDYIAPGETVFVLPFGAEGDAMLWQASTGMYFKLAGGFLGYSPLLPQEYARWPIAPGLYDVAGVPDAGEQMKAFLASHGVGAVIVSRRGYRGTRSYAGRPSPIMIVNMPLSERRRSEMERCLESLGVPPLEIGGISLYRIPPPQTPDQHPSALEMQQRAASVRFRTLLVAAKNYLAQGRDLAHLTPQAVQSLGLVPLDWFGGEPFPVESGNPVFHTASILGPLPHGAVGVGIEGSYATLQPIVERYRPWALAVYFPYPAPLAPLASDDDRIGTLVISFDREGLARAAGADH